MIRQPRRLRKLAYAAAGLLVLLVGVGAWFLRVDDIPAELPPVQGDPLAIAIAPLGAEPALELAALTGKTAFFVVVGPQVGESKEGQALNRALNRWVFPQQTVGFIVGDGEGFAMLREKVTKVMGQLGAEMRYPLYVDFEGIFVRTFGLAKGHHGFVVLGPDGSVLERRSGGAEGEDLERIRELLGAREPEPGPPAPEFAVAGIDRDACSQGTPCALVFLGREVARADIPNIPDGFDGDDEEELARMREPSIRLVSTVHKAELERARGVVIGRVHELELTSWQRVDHDAELRADFGVAADEAAIIVIDELGRIAVDERGMVPIYKWGRVADILGVELDERKKK